MKILGFTPRRKVGRDTVPLTPELKSELLSREGIKKWFDNCGARRDELLSAMERLASLPEMRSTEDVCASFDSTASAICHGIKIFVSYKIGHGRAARALLEPFELYSNGRVLFDDNPKWPFLCEMAGLQGRPYKDLIHAALEDTHWFFLLLPDASIDRSWTMFEAGFFRRAMQSGDRLICIHHPTVKPAGPLEDFERVIATHDELISLYRHLLCEPDAILGMGAINARLKDEHLDPHINKLIEWIQPTPELKRHYYVSYLDIKLDQRHPINTRDDLLSAQIVAGNDIDRIFGSSLVFSERIQDEAKVERSQSEHGVTLKEIIGNEEDLSEHFEWLDALMKTLRFIFKNKEPAPIEAIIRGVNSRFYQPVLQTVRRRSYDNALVSAHISLHEKINTPILRAPGNLEALSTALRLGYRFRWEVIEEFRNVESSADVVRIEHALERMEQESRERNLLRPAMNDFDDIKQIPLVRVFRGKDQETVVEMYKAWDNLRNTKGDGRLDKALKERNKTEIALCLEELDGTNRRFMCMAAKRFAELVDGYWAE
jgi:hypothetical protein